MTTKEKHEILKEKSLTPTYYSLIYDSIAITSTKINNEEQIRGNRLFLSRRNNEIKSKLKEEKLALLIQLLNHKMLNTKSLTQQDINVLNQNLEHNQRSYKEIKELARHIQTSRSEILPDIYIDQEYIDYEQLQRLEKYYKIVNRKKEIIRKRTHTK